MLFILSCSSEIYILYLCFCSSEVKYLCKCNMYSYFFKYTSLVIGGSSTHKTSAGARTGMVRCADGHRPICSEIFESSWRFSDIVRCPSGARTVAVETVQFKFETKIVRFPSDVCKHRTVPGRCY